MDRARKPQSMTASASVRRVVNSNASAAGVLISKIAGWMTGLPLPVTAPGPVFPSFPSAGGSVGAGCETND